MQKTFTPEELDAEWRRLADEGDPFTRKLEAAFQQAAREYEALLRSLRKKAELSLAKDDAEKEAK